MVTERHLRRLVGDGWIRTTDDGQYTLVGLVQGYINDLKDEQRTIVQGWGHASVQPQGDVGHLTNAILSRWSAPLCIAQLRLLRSRLNPGRR